MKIAGYEKLSLQDYPNHISCIIFTQGCNMKCPFCQNSTLIPTDAKNLISEDDILNFLNLRKNFLDGVTISGGEPTLQKDLKSFIKKVKEFDLDVKLDTNGLNYDLLKELVDEKLINYVAMDIKNSSTKYGKTSGVENINLEKIRNSINFLKQKKVDYEFRVTIMNEHHEFKDILDIIGLIGDSKLYLQNFKLSSHVLDKNLTELTEEKLKLWNKKLKDYPNVFIRGINKEEKNV